MRIRKEKNTDLDHNDLLLCVWLCFVVSGCVAAVATTMTNDDDDDDDEGDHDELHRNLRTRTIQKWARHAVN